MRHDKLERELDLLLLLTENRDYTVEDLCRRLNISRRSLYYYLDFFRDCGFHLEKRGRCYRILRSSPFFARLTDAVSFTEEEAVIMRRLLSAVTAHNAVANNLRRKLERFYDFDIMSDLTLRQQAAHNVSVIYDAIKYKQLAKLVGYSSPHSHTKRDRIVEPFLLLNNNNEVRCYEPSSGMNKTFKVSRMADVKLLDLTWEHEQQHRQMYTDVFMFSSERQMDVKLRLGQLAYNVLQEEYPQAMSGVTPHDENHWMLSLKVCSYVGISRFVFGLFEDIEVLGDSGFKAYLQERTRQLAAQWG